jgi:hypothetical protein
VFFSGPLVTAVAGRAAPLAPSARPGVVAGAGVAAGRESHIGQGHLGLDVFFVLVPV